jgi:hypothetical protein
MTLRAELIGETYLISRDAETLNSVFNVKGHYLANGLRVRSLPTLCRKLLEAGHDPGQALEVFRATTLALLVRSIGEGASLRVTSNEQGTPVFGPANPSSEPQDSFSEPEGTPIAPQDPERLPDSPARLPAEGAANPSSVPEDSFSDHIGPGNYEALPEPSAGEASP